MTDAPSVLLHASSVCLADKGLLIVGPSGSGKSTLALELMALGASLIADDKTVVTRSGTGLILSCPAAIEGAIEARGIGVLAARSVEGATLSAVFDLSVASPKRLPETAHWTKLDCKVPLFGGPLTPYLPAQLIQLLKCGLRRDL